MKKVLIIILLLVVFDRIARADIQESFVTGKDWVHRMTPKEKYISLLSPTLLFEGYNIRLRHSLPEVIQWIDRLLKANPQLENEDVSNIFASTLLVLEPENRGAIKIMERNFLRGDYDVNAFSIPRLDIEETQEAASPTDSIK